MHNDHARLFPCWPCYGCGRPLKQPLWWKVTTTHGYPYCSPCWRARLEVEKSAAVAWASVECRAYGYELDQRQGVRR